MNTIEMFNKLLDIKFKNLPMSEEPQIEISKDIYNRYTVCLIPAWVAHEDSLSGDFGVGNTIEEATADYIKRITGKTLIIEVDGKEYESDIVE